MAETPANMFTLRAKWIFPVVGPPIEGGWVTITEGRILAIGAGRRAGQAEIDRRPFMDLGDVALLPGFVNAHTHLEFSLLERPLGRPGMPLVEWIRDLLACRVRSGHNVAKALDAGCLESLRGGVTTVGEIATADLQAYQRVPLRPRLTLFREAIGFSRARVESVAAAVAELLEEDPPSGPEARDDESLGLGISPHAPYTVSLPLVSRLAQMAVRRNLAVAMHVAESLDEMELLASGSGPFRGLLEERSMWDDDAIPAGTTPLDYLHSLSAAPRSLIIHGNYLRDEEWAFLADRRANMTLVHCPRTHAYFGHPELPLATLMERRVRVAMGTDSRASNPDLSLLGELRCLADRHPDLAPTRILEMGTLLGAEALGLDDRVGSLTPGKSADLVAIPLAKGTQKDANKVLAALLASQLSPTDVWLAGQRLDLR